MPNIGIVCALYHEASPLISHLKLKKNPNITNFQIFEGEKHVVIISGTGIVQSSIATTFLYTQYPNIITLINIGVCGSNHHAKNTLLRIDHIVEDQTNKTFFPDSFSNIVENFSLRSMSKAQKHVTFKEAIDMEGSGFFQAASSFIKSHAIGIFKIVSDNLETTNLESEKISTSIQKHLPTILQEIEKMPIKKTRKKIENPFLNIHWTATASHQRSLYLSILKVHKEKDLKNIINSLQRETQSDNILKKLKEECEQIF